MITIQIEINGISSFIVESLGMVMKGWVKKKILKQNQQLYYSTLTSIQVQWKKNIALPVFSVMDCV